MKETWQERIERLRESKDVHVMPSGWDHKTSSHCWCRPQIERDDSVSGARIWVHKAPA